MPVGDDQRQHVEITRDIAIRFNHRFGETFVVPEAVTPPVGARVMDLQNPIVEDVEVGVDGGRADPAARRPRRASPASSSGPSPTRRTRSATTATAKPGVSNLLEILGAATGQRPAELAEGYTQYGPLKADAGDAVIELLAPIQARYRELVDDRGQLAALLRKGADEGPRGGRRRRSSGPTTPSGCSRPESRPRPPAMNRTDRRIIALAVPALGSLAVEPLYVLVDTAIVGRLGTAQLGGLAIAATVLGLVVAGCNFLTYGTTERVARRLGAGRPGDAADVAVQTMWLSTMVGVVVAPLVGLAAPTVAGWLGGSGEVFDFGVTYLRITAVGLPFVIFALGAQGVQRGATDYRTPLVILLTANLVNAVLEVRVRVRVRLGRAGFGVVDGDRPGRCRRRLRRRGPPPPPPGPPSPPELAGMAPLMTRRPLPAAARRLDARRAPPGPRRSPPASTRRRWPPTRSPPACCCSSPWPSTPWRSRPRRSSPRSSARAAGRPPPTSPGAACACRSSSGPALAVVAGGRIAFVPHAVHRRRAVVDRATAALLWLAAMIVPAAVAFAYDGVLIGAGDYRFLGLAALAYLVAVAPIGAVVLATDGGIGAIWAGLAVWMVLRAVCNHVRATRLLAIPTLARVGRDSREAAARHRRHRLPGWRGGRAGGGRAAGRSRLPARRDVDVRDAAAVVPFVGRPQARTPSSTRPTCATDPRRGRSTSAAARRWPGPPWPSAPGWCTCPPTSSFDGRAGRPYREDDPSLAGQRLRPVQGGRRDPGPRRRPRRPWSCARR